MQAESTAAPRRSLATGREAEPCSLVIFGVFGDLSRRKLLPALYNLALDGQLPDSFRIVGVGRRPTDTATMRAELEEAVREHSRRPFDAARWKALADVMCYACTESSEGYHALANALQRAENADGAPGNRLFYLAVPPSAFVPIVEGLRSGHLNRPGKGGDWCRLVVEKPVGTDLESACELNRDIHAVFRERDVFRIDHYLGKETVQNLLVFRFGNAIFEPLWNHKYVDHVQITVSESLGVERRGKYYEEAGATRDMVQNHLLQLLCLVGMEPPATLNADSIRDEKVKVLHSLRPIPADAIDASAVRAQYTAGAIDGTAVPGYREEPDVAPDSGTETFVALRVFVDNWRWADVPFYLRTGKRLPSRATEISLHFRDVPHRLFSGQNSRPSRNVIALRIQPDEGIRLSFDAKVPSAEPEVRTVEMDFDYDDSFRVDSPEAYERLLLDALLGDPTLFIRGDEVEAAWRFVDPLLEAWRERKGLPLPEYVAGSWGPTEADLLLADDRRRWRRL